MIRAERNSDTVEIQQVLSVAFPTDAESKLVGSLRRNGNLPIAWVAEASQQVVGFVGFSPVSIQSEEPSSSKGLGLAPLAVLPAHQKKGIGGQLVEAGIGACRNAGWDFLVVLGEPEYYQRFGFSTASRWGLDNDFGVDDPFMVFQLRPDGLKETTGKVLFSAEFQAFS